MARISGMMLGLGLLIAISSMVSPASAWDSDDDDGYQRRRWRHPHYHGRSNQFAPLPVYAPPRYVGGYGVPYSQPTPAAPLAPEPLPPSQLPGSSYQSHSDTIVPPIPPSQLPGYSQHPGTVIAPPLPPELVSPLLPQARPGQFVNSAVPLYPLVRVKDGHKVPRFAVHRVVAVRSPDPLRFPGCVYVQICVPPTPCRDVEVDDRGAKIELKYGEYEVEIKSSRGVVVVKYDD